MNTLSIRVRYRPIRLGFCVQKGNMDELRRALQLSHAFWGGRFNPVIPVGASEEDRCLAKSLVEVFQVDALYPLSTAEPLKAFVQVLRSARNKRSQVPFASRSVSHRISFAA
jgi:hypothetical protein